MSETKELIQKRLETLAFNLFKEKNFDEEDVIYSLNLLFKEGLDVSNSDALLHKAIPKGYTKTVSVLIDRGIPVLADGLVLAINCKQWEIAELLLSKDVDVKANNNEALCKAARYASVNFVENLINLGADIHAQNEEPLCNAIRGNNQQVFDLLISKGANVSARKNLPIIIASEFGQTYMLQRLIELNVDITAQNNSALKEAVRNEENEVIEILCKEGAKVTLENLESAIFSEDLAIVKTLMHFGGLTASEVSYLLIFAISTSRIYMSIIEEILKYRPYKEFVTRAIKTLNKRGICTQERKETLKLLKSYEKKSVKI